MGRRVRFCVGASVCVAVAILGACVTRPTVSSKPSTKDVVQIPILSKRISKIDLLFAIDNSASMGDKQTLLRDAVPDLITRLLVPLCVDPDVPTTVLGASVNGACDKGEIEFPPLTDLHVGVVSSSLGGLGSGACAAAFHDPTLPQAEWHNDDQGHLIARSGAGAAGARALLAWTPAAGEPSTFIAAFQDRVSGVGEYGCGFEAQEESWYRFLVQPDPYATIDTSSGRAVFAGVDEELLKERRDFLRPDSLVAIVQITDENESTVDPRSLGGRGFRMLDPDGGSAPRATAACAKDPNLPACSSCGSDENAGLPECATRTAGDDVPNVRFFHMKQRFGVDPMYPVARYTRGLGVAPDATGAALDVPNRAGTSCTNPLFAATLPSGAKDDLCALARGPRAPGLVFYAAITGVPRDLLPATGVPSVDDWTKMLGADPLRYDFTGADPRMLESIAVRPGVAGDRDTGGQDLQYACTFPLAKARACDANDIACDCKNGGPLCDPANGAVQVRAKAYPGVRHLLLARSLGQNGVVASICPDDTTDASVENARFGYRPAMRSIAERLGAILAAQCLPRPPRADASGRVPCLVLEAMTGDAIGDDACDRPAQGLTRADPAVLAAFRREHAAAHEDLSTVALCEKTQLVEAGGARCSDDPRAGWCYARGPEALRATRQKCPEAIVFSRTGQPASGHTVYLQCIEQAD